ncbi:MAG TPA: right-handed parallel beta-helix repeat-containing protein [Roseomonas sp.]|nr:right-handed parallel beta-helix repeat-containing protein [Roseomonas sp.]
MLFTIRSVLLASALGLCPFSVYAAEMVVPCANGEDVTAALQRAFDAHARPILLRAEQQGSTCSVKRSFLIPPDLILEGQGEPVLRLEQTGNVFRGNKESRKFTISGLTLDATGTPKSAALALRGSTDGRLERLRIIRPGDGIVLAEGSHGVTIRDLEVTDSRQHGVMIQDSYDNVVDGARLDGQVGFGVILVGTSHGNRLYRLSTRQSGLELVGMTARTHDNTLEESSAANTGDNCYSITGRNNRLRNLTGDRCAGNGIAFYGSGNTLDGGRFTNNAQRHNVRPAWSGGVSFSQGFGGVGQRNIVRNVVVDDNQSQPTQQVGIFTTAASYQSWRPGVAVRVGRYVYSGMNLYVARSSGVTGMRPPSGQGRVSDGAVEWEWVNSFDGTVQPDGNVVEGAQIGRAVRASREDHSEARQNVGTR